MELGKFQVHQSSGRKFWSSRIHVMPCKYKNYTSSHAFRRDENNKSLRNLWIPRSNPRFFQRTGWRNLILAMADEQPSISTQLSPSFPSFCVFSQQPTSRPFPIPATHGNLSYLETFVSFIGVTILDLTSFEHYQRSWLRYQMSLCHAMKTTPAAMSILRYFHPTEGRETRSCICKDWSLWTWHIRTKRLLRTLSLRKEPNCQLCWNPTFQKMKRQCIPRPKGHGDHISGQVRTPCSEKLGSYCWPHHIALDVPKDEALFLTKLDLTLISASALGVMCRYLDQVNITNAFSMFLSFENTAFYFWHVA